MKKLLRYFFTLILVYSVGCSDKKNEQVTQKASEETEIIPALGAEYSAYHVMMTGYDTTKFSKYYSRRIEPPLLDLNQSLEKLSLAELVVLKNTVLAMKGNLFEDAVLYAYFSKMPWYQPPYWNPDFSIQLSEEEEIFSKRIDHKIHDLLKQNYVGETASEPNPENIVNAFQKKEIISEGDEKLAENGFIIEPSENNQLFDIYTENQINQIPSFVTTDLFLQQMHLFYGTLENEIEEQYLIDILSSMLEIINGDLYLLYEKTLDPKTEKSIEENLLYYSIPYAVITDKKNNLIGDYNETYYSELGNVLAGEGRGSVLLRDKDFDYGIFKPVDHYSKNEQIGRYFKALTWLQKISLCLNNENDFLNAVLAAFVINRHEDLRNQYKKYMEYKTYFSSQKEQFTLWDLAEVLKEAGDIKTLDELFEEKNIALLKEKLNVENSENCDLSVSLMPIEYQNLFTDLREIDRVSQSPATLNLFAALGNTAAVNSDPNQTYNEKVKASVTENLISISGQEDAVSMDWLSTLLTSYNEKNGGPEYMHNSPWKYKELATAMASWVQLNERVFLEAEGVSADLASDSIRRSRILRGYVEPNTAFWEAASILLNNTKVFLAEHKILSGKTERNLSHLLDLAAFLHETSLKEISGTGLNANDYERIAKIGEECQNFALGLINPNYNTKYQRITSKLPFATAVFQSQENKSLISGTGYANTLLALVELDGFIYLTRGSVYSYYELSNYPAPSINKNQWINLLSGKTPPQEPKWIQDILVNTRAEEKLASAK